MGDILSEANLAYERGNHDQAERRLTAAIAAAAQAGELDKRLADSLANLAETYVEQAQFDKAHGLFVRGLVILKQAPGADRLDIAEYVNNLAALYHAKAAYLKKLAAVDRD